MPWPRTRWRIASVDPAETERLADAAVLSRPLAAALIARGLRDPQTIAAVLAPSLANLVPPETLPGIVAADARIRHAVANAEPIVVFGDFDADGVCAAVVLATAIEALGGRVGIFLPDRPTEGYGLTPAAVERALRNFPATRLVVTVDCGISQHAGCACCRAHGVDVIVTDHHTLPESLPDTVATVNPHLAGTPAALAPLAGVGVAFKLAHALARGPSGHRFDTAALLPIVALGTVADVASLTGENRVLVHAGLARLNHGRHIGLAALAKASRISGNTTAADLAFRLGPRINAAGRIGNPMVAVELLRTTDAQRAAALAKQLDAINSDRQQLEKDTCEEALCQLATQFDPQTHRAAVVWGADWHPGVLGLVAGRLGQRLHLPAVAIHLGADGEARGSARCPDSDDLDLMALLAPCAHLLLRHGGHRAAAGLSLRVDDVPAFAEAFRDACATALLGKDLRPTLDVDAWIDPSDLSLAFHSDVQRLEPCGAGHAPARWALRAVELAEAPKPMGADGKHFRFVFRTDTRATLNAVLFNADEDPGVFRIGDRLDIAFTTRLNDYWGQPELQLQLDDLGPSAMPQSLG
jgi:single-stranded-DNA-specific exonuclease